MPRTINISVMVAVPDNVSDEEITAWLDFVLNTSGIAETAILDKFPEELEALAYSWFPSYRDRRNWNSVPTENPNASHD